MSYEKELNYTGLHLRDDPQSGEQKPNYYNGVVESADWEKSDKGAFRLSGICKLIGDNSVKGKRCNFSQNIMDHEHKHLISAGKVWKLAAAVGVDLVKFPIETPESMPIDQRNNALWDGMDEIKRIVDAKQSKECQFQYSISQDGKEYLNGPFPKERPQANYRTASVAPSAPSDKKEKKPAARPSQPAPSQPAPPKRQPTAQEAKLKDVIHYARGIVPGGLDKDENGKAVRNGFDVLRECFKTTRDPGGIVYDKSLWDPKNVYSINGGNFGDYFEEVMVRHRDGDGPPELNEPEDENPDSAFE